MNFLNGRLKHLPEWHWIMFHAQQSGTGAGKTQEEGRRNKEGGGGGGGGEKEELEEEEAT